MKAKAKTIRLRLKAEGGGTIKVYDDRPIKCKVHGIETTWGALDPIQQLAVEYGLDSPPDLPCLLDQGSLPSLCEDGREQTKKRRRYYLL